MRRGIAPGGAEPELSLDHVYVLCEHLYPSNVPEALAARADATLASVEATLTLAGELNAACVQAERERLKVAKYAKRCLRPCEVTEQAVDFRDPRPRYR